MLLSIGTKVILKHSKEEAVVIELLEEDMVNVRLLSSDLEIPVFVEDIIRKEAFAPKKNPGKIVAGKKAKEPFKPDRPSPESQYRILQSIGIQLAFAPILKTDATTEKYEIYLINDTSLPVLFSFILELNDKVALRQNGKLEAASIQLLGEMKFDQLNDAPNCLIECWRIRTDGTGPRMEKRLKIKAKQFFKKVLTAPLLNRPTHLYRIFENLESDPNPKNQTEDLKSYTKRNINPVSSWLNIGDRMPHEVQEFAEFLPEIDLHIDKLEPNHKKLNKSSILRKQLDHFDAYIDKAIQLGVERVFIIHGIGEGRLRDQIASRLVQIPEVETFKNEYHARYGYGATEVIFK